MTIKSWFLTKNFSQNERYIIECAIAGGELNIKKETEKAYFFKAESDYGTFSFWCPKSCVSEQSATVYTEPFEIEVREDGKSYIKNFDSSKVVKSYYDRLVEWAKGNGVKGVRVGLKIVTIKQKIALAGLELPATI